MGIDFGKVKPKVIYFSWFNNQYWANADICLLKNKQDLLIKWHELGHAYVKRLNSEILRRKFTTNPEKYFVGKIISEGVAEYMSIEAALKFSEETKLMAEQMREKRYFGNDEFLYKAAFVFIHEVEEINQAVKLGKLVATKKFAQYMKSLEMSYYYLGYNYVTKMIKTGKDLENLIKNPPQKLEEIINKFEKPASLT